MGDRRERGSPSGLYRHGGTKRTIGHMRGLVAATAVLGVIAIGGLPVLALTLADAETSTGETTQPAADQRPGPPPWAHAYGRDGKPAKPDKQHKEKDKDKEAA